MNRIRLAGPTLILVSLSFGAQADSGAAPDNALGLPIGSETYDPTVPRDPRGKATMIPTLNRTPTGLLHDWAFLEPLPLALGNGWAASANIEAGGITKSHDEKSREFREYRDWRNGFLVNALNAGAERGGLFTELTAITPGRDDQGYRAAVGRRGFFEASAFLQDIPHLFSSRARTVYQGAGSGTLTLVPGLVPGDNTPDAVRAAAEAASPFELALKRRRAGLDFEHTPNEQWRFFARYTQERREGERPFGGTIGLNFPASPVSGGLSELIEPIRYRSHDFSVGAQLASATWQANVSYAGSIFRNEIGALTWDNPFNASLLNATAPLVTRGRTDLAPDNESHNVKLDFSRTALPLNGRFTGSFSWHRMTQDDALLAPTVNSGVLQATGTPGTLDLANWNTTAALSQPSANARIDTWLAELGYAFRPLRDLNVRTNWRHDVQDNRTRYTAFNPLTGQFGYPAADGAVFVGITPAYNGLFFPGNSALTPLPVHVRSIPFAYERDNARVEADYRLRAKTRLEMAYEREEYRREHRERDRTWEDKLRLAVNAREWSWATLRASYEYGKRSGSAYNADPYTDFYLTNLAPGVPPHTLAQLRKLDVADRTRHSANARMNILLRGNMDLMFTGRWTDDDYGSDYGRRGQRAENAAVDWSFQPRPEAGAFAHYDFNRQRMRQANINDDDTLGAPTSADANAGGAVYPFANAWEASTRDTTHVFTGGLRFAFSGTRLEASYSYVDSKHAIGYAFASPGALTPGTAREAEGGMPDMKTRRHILETSLARPIGTNMALRLYYRYERGSYRDWHYDGLPLVVENEVFLGAVPESYSVHVVGLFFQYSFGRQRSAN